MKFTLEVTLPARIDTTRGEGDATPFVRAVLAVDGVASVFGVSDFVTVMRDPDTDWNTIVCGVETAAAAYLPDEPGDRPAEDRVALARKLLRDAVVPPKPTTVEIRRAHPYDPDPND